MSLKHIVLVTAHHSQLYHSKMVDLEVLLNEIFKESKEQKQTEQTLRRKIKLLVMDIVRFAGYTHRLTMRSLLCC